MYDVLRTMETSDLGGRVNYIERVLKDGTKFQLVLVDNRPYVTMGTAGILLGYKNLLKSISNLYNAHKEEIEEYTLLIESVSSENLAEKRRLLSRKAFDALCFWAQTPKAKKYRKEILDIMEGYETTGIVIHPDVVSDGLSRTKLILHQMLHIVEDMDQARRQIEEHHVIMEEHTEQIHEQDQRIGDLEGKFKGLATGLADESMRIYTVEEKINDVVTTGEGVYPELVVEFEQKGKALRKKLFPQVRGILYAELKITNKVALNALLRNEKKYKEILRFLQDLEQLYVKKQINPLKRYNRLQILTLMDRIKSLRNY